MLLPEKSKTSCSWLQTKESAGHLLPLPSSPIPSTTLGKCPFEVLRLAHVLYPTQKNVMRKVSFINSFSQHPAGNMETGVVQGPPIFNQYLNFMKFFVYSWNNRILCWERKMRPSKERRKGELYFLSRPKAPFPHPFQTAFNFYHMLQAQTTPARRHYLLWRRTPTGQLSNTNLQANPETTFYSRW